MTGRRRNILLTAVIYSALIGTASITAFADDPGGAAAPGTGEPEATRPASMDSDGIFAYSDQTVEADRITITTDESAGSYVGIAAQASRLTINTGSEAGQGLILNGPGASSADSYGMNAFSMDPPPRNETYITVRSGNIDIHDYERAVQSGYASLMSTSGINLGRPESPVNDITIRNVGRGFSVGQGSSIYVNAKNLHMNDNVQTALQIEGRGYGTHQGTIDIHTSGEAVIAGTDSHAIQNTYGYLSINTGENDGSTRLTGAVYTEGDLSTTNISFHTRDSYFYGNAFDNALLNEGKTTITVSNGANWTLNPAVTFLVPSGPSVNTALNSFIYKLNVSNGTINLGGNGTEAVAANRYTRMQTTSLDGNGGTFVFRTNLQESADTHTVNGHSDQLIIAEGSNIGSGTDVQSSGGHQIMVNDYSRTLGQTARNGYVLLVRDESPNPGAVFTGSANLQNGGLYLHPVEITNEAPDTADGYTDVPTDGTNWYLRMTNPPEMKPSFNGENNITFARSRYGALWIEQDTLRQRVGELRNHTQDDGVWARIDRGEYSMNGVNGNADYTRYNIGYDKKIGSQKGQKQYIGMAYHHTDTDLNYRHFTDDSDMDADIGTIYYTNLQDKGHYLDVVGKFGRMKGKMKTFGDFPESAKWDSPFYSLSAEYGRKVMYKNDWYVEPQAQLTYSHLGSDSYLTSQGTHAHVDGINSLIFRTGFTVGKKDGQNEYYGKVFWHHEFEGAEDARFHDKNDDSLRDSYDFGGSWVTLGFGGQVGIGKDAYVYGDVDKSFGGDVKEKWAWNIGVRFGF